MRQRFGSWQRAISSIVLAVFSIQISGCNSLFNTDHLDTALMNVRDRLESEAQGNSVSGAAVALRQVDKLRKTRTELRTRIRNVPQLDGRLASNADEAKAWIRANGPRISQWLDSVDEQAKDLRQIIFDASKEAYLAKSEADSYRFNSVVFFALQYYRQMNRAISDMATPLMLGAANSAFDTDQEINAFRQTMLERIHQYLGGFLVSDRDLSNVDKNLQATETSQPRLAPEAIRNALSSVRVAVTGNDAERKARIKALVDQLPTEQRKVLGQELVKLQDAIKDATLLYTPGKNLSAAVKLLVWVGNLTWGLVNSLLGLGVVLATMIVSPFTEYVDFPTFRIAKNGMQIYVDVSGMSPMPGKMSLGIFELDNRSGPDFASKHEGVHAIQSALLGPFYLPTVLATYLISGFDRGFMEDWAWSWADL